MYKYNIAARVPLDGDISFKELAKSVDLKEFDIRRIIRFAAIHHRVFQEKKPGYISHTAASHCLVESSDAMACLGFMFDETYQAFRIPLSRCKRIQTRYRTSV